MNNVGNSVMYGGAFDLVTNGHLYVIKRATEMFSLVHVVVADNPSKKSMFSKKDRVKMMQEMVKSEFPKGNVIVLELPTDIYLVSFAKEKGCQALIRGIRDNIDFVYEQTICRTNKMICPDISTVYLMPEENVSLVSSSWVKGLLGLRGWQKIVKQAVHPCVFKTLQEMELHKKIDVILHGLFSEMHIQLDYRERSVTRIKEVMTAYRDRPYHNYEHILDGLEVFPKEHWENPDYVMLYAWLLHDVNPSEDKSLEITLDTMCLPFIGKEYVGRNVNEKWESATKKITSLIEASKHKTCEYETEEERIFASVDLMNLGGSRAEYNNYSSLVCDEYREIEKIEKGDKFDEEIYFDKWARGRFAFLKTFLVNRKFIYPSNKFRSCVKEQRAQDNLVNEIEGIQQYIDSRIDIGYLKE